MEWEMECLNRAKKEADFALQLRTNAENVINRLALLKARPVRCIA